MTRTAIAKGSEWGVQWLYEGWGSETSDEIATALGRLVVERFHELCAEGNASDIDWQPRLSEVTAEVYGENTDEHSMWERVRPEVDIYTLKGIASDEVWLAFIGNRTPMSARVAAVLGEHDV
jgi:hypothetical protein